MSSQTSLCLRFEQCCINLTIIGDQSYIKQSTEGVGNQMFIAVWYVGERGGWHLNFLITRDCNLYHLSYGNPTTVKNKFSIWNHLLKRSKNSHTKYWFTVHTEITHLCSKIIFPLKIIWNSFEIKIWNVILLCKRE